MRSHTVGWLTLFVSALTLTSGNVRAQDELGLDLTSSADYRPTLAIIGVGPIDPAVPPDLGARLHVDRLAPSLVTGAEQLAAFSKVMPPAEVFEKLSETYAEALACAEVPCLQALAVELDVNLVMSGQLLQKDGHTVLRVVSFTRYTDALVVSEVSAELGPRDFERKALLAFAAEMKKLRGATLSLLTVKSATPGASALLGKSPVGKLAVTRAVPPGSYVLKVLAPGHLADEFDVVLVPGESEEIESNLVAQAPAPLPIVEPEFTPQVVQKPASPGRPLWKRPGLYVAVAGAAAVALGLSFGMSAKAIERRAVDGNGDGALDITPKERSKAVNDAMLANVLVGAGGAALAGGTIWVLLTPASPKKKLLEGPSDGLAFAVGYSGTFP